jgi:hypothetical protein
MSIEAGYFGGHSIRISRFELDTPAWYAIRVFRFKWWRFLHGPGECSRAFRSWSFLGFTFILWRRASA